MSEAVKAVTLIDIIFVVMLVLSGSFGTAVGDVIYYSAFLITVALGFAISEKLKYKREEIKGVAEPLATHLTLDKERVGLLIPLVAPTVLLIFIVSLVSTLVCSLFGVAQPPIEERGFAEMIFIHALLPAFFEEALFRYVAMKLLMPYSKRFCIIYSALCFALIHCSFVQMPYAFIAGLIFMTVDVAFDSIWPSVVLHFINNATSVFLIKYSDSKALMLVSVILLVPIIIASLFFLLRSMRKYKEMAAHALEKGERAEITYAPFILVAICLYIALITV